MDLNKLKEPFNNSQVRWRVGRLKKDKTAGTALAYVDARDVQDRLDDVVGTMGWSTRYEYNGKTCVCYLTIDGNTKADGAGETNIEGEKGALSKAFVRAASAWGIGRYFYNAREIWVEIDKWQKIKESEQPKLDMVHEQIAKGVVIVETPPPAKVEPKVDVKVKVEKTDDEKFEIIRKGVLARNTLEQVENYHARVTSGVSEMGGDYPKQIIQMFKDRKAQINGESIVK